MVAGKIRFVKSTVWKFSEMPKLVIRYYEEHELKNSPKMIF